MHERRKASRLCTVPLNVNDTRAILIGAQSFFLPFLPTHIHPLTRSLANLRKPAQRLQYTYRSIHTPRATVEARIGFLGSSSFRISKTFPGLNRPHRVAKMEAIKLQRKYPQLYVSHQEQIAGSLGQLISLTLSSCIPSVAVVIAAQLPRGDDGSYRSLP